VKGFSRKIFSANTTVELENKINEFEERFEISDININVNDCNNSPSGVIFLASIIYKI